jgi:peptidoglycan/xylan/chitin deacetylase (PgdA/CDA1 family)
MDKVILICADCEGTHQQIVRIFNAFQNQGIKVNFFFVGETAEENKSLVKEIALFHNVDSHTYNHANLRKLSKEEQRREILRGKHVVEEIVEKPTYGFRAPYHAINRATVEILNEEKFVYDASVLYYRYNMRNVVEIHPSWFREWTGLYEFLHISPRLNWKFMKLLFKFLNPLVLAIHPHYSGRNDVHAQAMIEFLDYAREQRTRILTIPEYLNEKKPGLFPPGAGSTTDRSKDSSSLNIPQGDVGDRK